LLVGRKGIDGYSFESIRVFFLIQIHIKRMPKKEANSTWVDGWMGGVYIHSGPGSPPTFPIFGFGFGRGLVSVRGTNFMTG